MVYASTHLSLAALEVLAHCNQRSFRDSRMSIRFEIPDILMQRLPDEELPTGWDGIPEPIGTQSVGDAWILARSAVGLIVPTAALPGGTRLDERNVVLNPSIPNFLSHIRNASVEPFDFDARIATLVRA